MKPKVFFSIVTHCWPPRSFLLCLVFWHLRYMAFWTLFHNILADEKDSPAIAKSNSLRSKIAGIGSTTPANPKDGWMMDGWMNGSNIEMASLVSWMDNLASVSSSKKICRHLVHLHFWYDNIYLFKTHL